MNTVTERTLRIMGQRLDKVDQLLVHLMARRVQLSKRVAEAKLEANEPTIRLETEEQRLAKIREWAGRDNISPNFAFSLLYFIIGESCREQVSFRDCNAGKPLDTGSTMEYAQLRQNLLNLTEAWAESYDQKYGRDRFATKMHLDFEHGLLQEHLQESPGCGSLVDLGCATGREILLHHHNFTRRVGYDISPAMIAVANRKIESQNIKNTRFEVCDVEQGLPLQDNSASFVFMNGGTGSDVRDIRKVLSETCRVLVPEGRFLFSFYNAGALVYKTFLPWPLSLWAAIDGDRKCLEVSLGGKTLLVYAQPYTVDQVRDLFPKHLTPLDTRTHPAVSPILPNDVFDDQGVQDVISSVDRGLANEGNQLGAYITVVGKKSG